MSTQLLFDMQHARANLKRNVSAKRGASAREFTDNVCDARRLSRYCERAAARLAAGRESNKRLTLVIAYARFAHELSKLADYYDLD